MLYNTQLVCHSMCSSLQLAKPITQRMQQDTLLIVTVLLAITGGEAYSGVILRHPETQLTLADGSSKLFVCTGQGDVIWYIDDRWLSPSYEFTLEGKGYEFSETQFTDVQFLTKNLTMTVPSVNSLNGTKIQCKTAGSDGNVIPSNVAWLRIVGPPLPPDVRLKLVNWSTIQLSWAAPFTTEGYPIEKYIVYTTNTTTDQRTRTDIYPTTGTETHTILDIPGNCHTLQFEVFAENAAGLSTAGEASEGFPVAVSEIDENVSVVLLLEDLRPLITISFHLPDICADSGVSATYIVELIKTSADVVVHRTTAVYQHSIFIEETQELDSCTSYTVNVTMFIPSHAELGSFSTDRLINLPSCPTDSSTEPAVSTSTNVASSSALTDTPSKSSTDSSTEPAVSTSTNVASSSALTDTPSKSSTDGSTEPTVSTSTNFTSSSSESETTSVILVVVGVVVILLLLIVVGVMAVCLYQMRHKTMSRRTSTMGTISRPLPPMATNPIYDANDVSPVYDVIQESACKAKPQQRFKKQLSCDLRYTPTPSSLPLHNEVIRNRSMSMCQSPLSPETPSPREVDAMLRNTFGGTPSPLSQMCGHGGSRAEWGSQVSGVFDTLSKKTTGGEGEKCGGGNDVEREDCYVLMQSNVV